METYINNWFILTKKFNNGYISTVATKGYMQGNMFVMEWDAERIRSVGVKGRATKAKLEKMHAEFIDKNRHLLK